VDIWLDDKDNAACRLHYAPQWILDGIILRSIKCTVTVAAHISHNTTPTFTRSYAFIQEAGTHTTTPSATLYALSSLLAIPLFAALPYRTSDLQHQIYLA